MVSDFLETCGVSGVSQVTQSDVDKSVVVVVIVHFNRLGGPPSFDSRQRCRFDRTSLCSVRAAQSSGAMR